MRRAAIFLLLAGGLPGEILDRIAANVGYEVITESQVKEEIRVTAFLNSARIDDSKTEMRKALDRLIDQSLIRAELEFSRYPAASDPDIDTLLSQVKGRYPTPESYAKALEDYGVDEPTVRAHLGLQLTALRFIDFRFRPGIHVSDDEVEQEYRRYAAEFQQKNGKPAPSLEESRSAVEKILTEQLVDRALDRWIAEVRTQTRIRYRDEVFQ